MRVGITTLIEYSVFSAGVNNTSIALAELMAALGHDAALLNLRGRKDWWDDCKALQKNFKVVHLEDVPAGEKPFDLLLEVGGLTVTPQQRSALAATAIWVLRKPFVVSETELSIYPVGIPARDTTGIKQAWLLTDVTSPDDVSAVETLTRVPVLTLPFVWSPLPAEAHYRGIGAPAWTPDLSGNLFDVHMVDTNMTSASSSTLSLVILREAKRRRLPIGGWALHNGESIAKSKFFRENVLKHCSDLDLSGACVGRQRCVEWTATPGAIAMAHLRFMRLRPVLLDLAWVGIPTIHNSVALRDVGEGADRLFYSDNSVCGGADALEALIEDLSGGVGWFSAGAGERRREAILRRWSPLSPLVKSIWGTAIQEIAAAGAAPAPAAAAPASVAKGPVEPKTFRIVFANMWADFNPAYNFFTLLLNAAGKHMNPPVSVEGYAHEAWSMSEKPDLVIFGPFGADWLRYDASVPRVCYTGENTGPVDHPSVKLNMGHEMTYMKSDYLRVPHWVLSVNWFGADVDRLVNPRPIPLELCVRPPAFKSQAAGRSKFAAFVVSNPRNPVRNLAFDWVNSYKPVDSGGMLYNNIGDQLAAGLGGGGGEWKKVKFYQDYRFVLAYENGSNKGYCTEKYLHAKAAGAVPIYWGDPDFQRDFDPAGCIDARQCRTRDDLVALVRAVEENPEEWARRAAVPAFDEYKVGLARRLLSEAAGRIFGILGAATDGIPRFLGAEPGSAEARVGMEYFQASAPVTAATASVPASALTQAKAELPILVTFTSLKFLGSLQHWLKALVGQSRVLPELRAMVFLHNDVPADTVAKLKETYPFATFEPIPHEWHPQGFSDFWAPMNYAWKLWLFNHLNTLESVAGRLFLYIDSGGCLVRFPKTLLAAAATAGVACLEDPREENDRWCSEQFCEELAVTDEERAQKQIAACILAFRAGHPAAVRFFGEAFALGQKRHLVVGPKIGGLSLDGKCYGHRHDQSILSILVRRHAVPLIPLDEVYCQTTMRETLLSGRAIYVHRGNFAKHIAFLPGIQEAHVINLDRRADRLKRFWENHPGLEERVVRCSATDGRALTLTPTLARLFRANDFFWKKSVMGCAMSHLSLWWRLVNDTPDINNYLIFEDDAKMEPGWQEAVVAAMADAPEDYDVLFLGGILPPNRSAFETVIRPVNEHWAKVRPNQIFGQPRPTSYFHTCAYAYVLSRAGAIKVLDSIREHDGYWTSADHMLCNRVDEMNIYFLNPGLAKCYQDDDPKYANADFNNFSRVDEFDSDLWNNDERFSKEEVLTALASAPGPFDVATSLRAVFGKPGASALPQPPSGAPQATSAALQAPPKPIEGVHPPLPPMVRANSQVVPARIVSFKEYPIDFNAAYERDWLMTLWGDITHVNLYTMTTEEALATPPDDCPIVLFQRPHVPAITRILRAWSDAGATFRILHLSDEHVDPEHQDPLVAYTFKGCHSVLRNYIRADIPEPAQDKVSVIPLGYRWSPKIADDMRVAEHTPQIPFREYHWSFFGTNWNGRAAALAPLLECKLHGNYKLLENWNDPSGLTREEYLGAMLDSVFVPCPDGNNPETFRFYEALQAGCIPLVVKTKRNEAWFTWVSKHLPLITNTSWQETIRIMVSLLTKPDTLEIYRGQVLKAWAEWKETLREQASQWLLSVA